MRKTVAISLLMLILLTACSNQSQTIAETTAEIVAQTTTELFMPVHPDSISLRPDDYFSDLASIVQHRFIYYFLPGQISDLVQDQDAVEEWIYENMSTMEVFREMPLMQFVQYFNISKEEFLVVVENTRENYIRLGISFDDDEWELPCPDIIYTFDNDIISAFYRRENPVAPDWWPVER